jgi:hypothetical protein
VFQAKHDNVYIPNRIHRTWSAQIIRNKTIILSAEHGKLRICQPNSIFQHIPFFHISSLLTYMPWKPIRYKQTHINELKAYSMIKLIFCNLTLVNQICWWTVRDRLYRTYSQMYLLLTCRQVCMTINLYYQIYICWRYMFKNSS